MQNRFVDYINFPNSNHVFSKVGNPFENPFEIDITAIKNLQH